MTGATLNGKKSPIYVRHSDVLYLTIISTDAGDGKGEQTLITLTPREALDLGKMLVEIGEANGGRQS